MNKHLSSALYSILKPLISLMFRNGVSFAEFSRITKHAYIKETEKELLASEGKATTSSIAIITGLTRKDVSALRKESLPKSKEGKQKNRAIRVITGWLTDPDFSDVKGHSKVLDIQGDDISFETLVNRHSGDMPYKALIKELIRTEAVVIIDNKKVALVREAYIPSNDENTQYDVLGEDVSSLISTIKHNIVSSDSEPRYQRKVSYDKIPAELLGEFKALANKENQLLLLKLNVWLAQHDVGNKKIENPMKVGVGVYYFEESSKGQEVKNV